MMLSLNTKRLAPSVGILTVWILSIAQGAEAQEPYYKLGSSDEIKKSARDLAYDLMLYYPGNKSGEVPGILPGPPDENKGDYYWWQGGALMGTYIDYWYLTGDDTYNDVIMQGMLHQTSPNGDYQPRNYTASLGNDDQGFWGMSAMLAAENKFPNPPEDDFQWLELAQGVWNTQADPERHDKDCNGGMRWQVPPTNVGYDYKNAIANGCFFNLGARLARYTKNDTYAKHAEETWDWVWGVHYIDHKNWNVYDGGHTPHNCTDIDYTTYSYNAAIYLEGAAYMYNYTEDEKWKTRVNKLADAMLTKFFPKGIAYEVSCEMTLEAFCSADMLSFKGYVHRWLATSTKIVPGLREKILPVLRKSAEAAVKQCTGGESGRACGFYWSRGGEYVDPSNDRTTGAGEAMNVLAAVSSLLIDDTEPPANNDTGISKGNPNAGSGGNSDTDEMGHRKITAGDRAGAAILTILIVGGAIALYGWMTVLD